MMDGTQTFDSGDLYRKMTAILREVFEDDALEATPQLTADDVDGWDSLNHMRLMLAVQKRFGVKFSAAEVGKLGNVGDLVALVRAKA
jgi:acyl carrier protein